MKKILAIAVATAIAAPAMADMTIGGTYAFGYTETAGDGGFGTDTAAISVSGAGEVMEGVAIKAGISAGGLTRGASAVTGENAYMTLSGDFGAVTLAEVESGSGIRGLGQAGAPVNNMEGEILGAASNVTLIKYVLPAMGAVTVDLSHAQTTGMGTGDDTGSNGIGATAKLGMVTARADYTAWAQDATTDDRVRVSAKADLGSFAVGYGYEDRNYSNNTERTNSIIGVSTTVGSTAVGAAYVTTETTGAAELSGWTVGLSQAIGGGLSLSANYSDWEASATTDETKTNVILAYSF